MLDRINTVGKILKLSIPEIESILDESKRPVPGLRGYFDHESYYRDIEEGLITIALQVYAIQRRLDGLWTRAICREQQKLHRCLRIFLAEIDERQEYLNLAQSNGWYQERY